MRKLYREYKDIVVFRIVYIREAHASDGERPVPYAKDLGLTEPKDYKERCAIARRFINDGQIKIPIIIDNMDNKVEQDYRAFPGRVFLVDKMGQLAVVGGRGPWGIAPALKQTGQWLAQYREELEKTDPAIIKQKIEEAERKLEELKEELRKQKAEEPDVESQARLKKLNQSIDKQQKLLEELKQRLTKIDQDKADQKPDK